MQRDASRFGDVLIDRVAHQLMTEDQHAARVGQQPGGECRLQLLDQLSGPPAGDR
jgi:hypothetical protein